MFQAATHWNWAEQHVIITGGSSGIGAALARALSARGARIGLIARNEERLRNLAGERGTWAAADVRDAAGLKSAIAQLEAAHGPCTVLIANAGLHHYSPGYDLSADAAGDVIQVNVNGVINAVAAVVPGMLARGAGRICTIASIAGLIGLPDVGAYCASKAALITLSESWRLDLFRRGIRVTCVCPGFVRTPLIRNHDPRILKWVLAPEDAAERILAAIARGRALVGFPWPLWTVGRLARLVPRGWYRWAVRRLLGRVTPPRVTEESSPAR